MIKLYSSGCPSCKMLERILTKNNIEYEIKDLVNDKESLDFLTSNNITHAPILEIETGELLKYADALKWAKENAQ